MTDKARTVWIEISSSALRHNLAQIKGEVGPSVKVMAVVKANAYGHGALIASQVFEESGVDYLGVTTLEEGLELRSGKIKSPILIFLPVLSDQAEAAVQSDLDITICDLDSATGISTIAQRMKKTVRIHVNLDTGMGRLGIHPKDAYDFLRSLAALPGLEIAGIYTHFANAGSSDLTSAREQNALFRDTIEQLRSEGICFDLVHAANSSAILNLPETHYNMVRPGTILYGQYPSKHIGKRLDLQQTWCLKTRIAAIRNLPPGTSVGYRGEFVAERPTVAAVIPVGYAEGFAMVPESLARRQGAPLKLIASRLINRPSENCVEIRGKLAPVIGRVSMQMCSVDVTNIPDVHLGDEVIVPTGRVTTSSKIPRIIRD